MKNADHGNSQTAPGGDASPDGGLAMPVDQESSLFLMTPEQHHWMMESLREEFLRGRSSANPPVDSGS